MHTKQEIIEGYKSIWKQVEDVVSKVDSTQFLANTDEKTWSIAEEFYHVLKAASAMSSAMKNKPILLKWKFGKPNRRLEPINRRIIVTRKKWL